MTRSSHRKFSIKKCFLRIFAKFKGKHMWQSFFFNKVAGLTLFKKRLWHRCFPVNFAKFLRTPLENNLGGCFWMIILIHTFWKKSSPFPRYGSWFVFLILDFPFDAIFATLTYIGNIQFVNWFDFLTAVIFIVLKSMVIIMFLCSLLWCISTLGTHRFYFLFRYLKRIAPRQGRLFSCIMKLIFELFYKFL